MTDQSVREELYEKDKESLESDMSPFGFILDGSEPETIVDKKEGVVWRNADQYDEYGVPFSPWQWEERTYGGNPNWWERLLDRFYHT